MLIKVPEGEIIHRETSLHPLHSIATVKCFFSYIYFSLKLHVAQPASRSCGEGLLAIRVS